MSVDIVLMVWAGGILALGTFVLIGRVTDGYERSFLGPVASILLLLLAVAYAAGFSFLADIVRTHGATYGLPHAVLAMALAPALVFAIPVALAAPLRGLLVLILVYGATVGLHYLPPLFPALQPPLLDMGLKLVIAFVLAVPIYLSLFGVTGWGWLIPFAFALQFLGPLAAQYLLNQAGLDAATGSVGGTGSGGGTGGTGTEGSGAAVPDATMLHLRVGATIFLTVLSTILAFLALRRRPY